MRFFRKKIIRIITSGGIGDILLSTPSFKALKQKYPRSKIIVFHTYMRHRVIYENNPYIDSLRHTNFLADPINYCLYHLRLAKFHYISYELLLASFTYKNRNAKEVIAEMLGVELEDKNVQVFLTPAEEQRGRELLAGIKNPIALHITSLTSKNQEWPEENWEQLIRSMPDYTFVQLGLSEEKKIEGAVDFRGKTSYREVMAIVKHCIGFAGVNSSLSILSNAFPIPGVVLFGPCQPEVWGHDNNINLYKKQPCAPCLELLYSTPCPYGKTCMREIGVQEVKESLLRQLEAKTRTPH